MIESSPLSPVTELECAKREVEGEELECEREEVADGDAARRAATDGSISFMRRARRQARRQDASQARMERKVGVRPAEAGVA